jgi:hypothetical protein
VQSLPLEDIYANPHSIDRFLEAGEPVQFVRDGRAVAELVPRKTQPASESAARPVSDYRRRFLEMWGPDALESKTSVAEEFAQLRRDRGL